MRRVQISLPGAAAPKEMQSNATTWGVLQKELEETLNISFENTKVRDRKTNHHYSSASAELPMENLQLIVSTDKNKSGTITKANYHKANFSELRTYCKKITGFAPNGKQACIDALDSFYNKNTTKKKEKTVKETISVVSSTSNKSLNLETKLKKLEKRVSFLEKRLSSGVTPEEDSFWN